MLHYLFNHFLISSFLVSISGCFVFELVAWGITDRMIGVEFMFGFHLTCTYTTRVSNDGWHYGPRGSCVWGDYFWVRKPNNFEGKLCVARCPYVVCQCVEPQWFLMVFAFLEPV